MTVTKIRGLLALLIPVCALIAWQLTAGSAHADGGAPNLAYVSGTPQGISVIDVAKQTVDRTIKIDGNPHTIQLSPDGRFLYITQPDVGRVSVLGAKDGNTICSADIPGQPTLLVLDLGVSNKFYVAGNGTAGVRELDPETCKITRTYPTSGPVYGLAIANVASSISKTSGNQLWVATDKGISIFDDLNGKQLGEFAVEGGPQFLSIPGGATVYATTRQGSVVAIDLNTHEVITLVSGGKYGPMDYDQNTGQIYVPDQSGNRLVVLAPVTSGFPPPKQPVRMIDLGVAPESVAITVDGQLGFVALGSGDVAMLDIPGKQLVNTFHVGGTPHFIITGLYPPQLGSTPQQANTWGLVANIAAYIFVAALLIVPILLFRKYTRARPAHQDSQEGQSSQVELVEDENAHHNQ